jgi:putative phosphoribosyl transferase
MLFRDRMEAGAELARRLTAYRGRGDVIVLGLPRGGIPVAYQVACELAAPLDVFLVRKLGVPGQEEVAMGDIATGGIRVLNDSVVRALGIPISVIDGVAEKEQRELVRREVTYRPDLGPPDVRGRIVILIDDGLATGSTIRAAVAALRPLGAAKIVVAVPVAAAQACAEFRHEVDEIVCAETPAPFYAVGNFYDDFSQTTDEEVRDLLERARAHELTPGGRTR